MPTPSPSGPAAPKKPAAARAARRWRIRVLWAVAGLFAFLFIIIAGGLAFLATEGGRNWAAAQLLDAVNEPGELEISAERTEGQWPFRGAFAGIEIRDGDGVWFTAERLAWHLDAWALLSGRLHIRDFAVEAGHMIRVQEGGPEPETPEPFSLPRVPDLPLSLRVDRIAAPGLLLPAEIAGIESRFDLSAHGLWEGRSLTLVAALRQEGEEGTVFTVGLKRDPETDGFELDLFLKDRQDGVLAALLNEPGLGPVTLRGEGRGTGQAWKGHLDIDAAQLGTGRITGEGGWREDKRLDVLATVKPGQRWPGDMAGIVGEEARLSFKLGFPQVRGRGTAIALDDLSLKAGDLEAQGTLQLDPDADELGGARIEGFLAAKLAAVLTLLEQGDNPIRFSGGDLRVDFKGALGMPYMTARLDASEAGIGDIALGTTKVDLELKRPESQQAAYALSVDASVDGFDPNLEDIPWPYGRELRLTGEGALDLDQGTMQLAPARLTGESLSVSAQGDWNIDKDTGTIGIDLDAAHLAAFLPDVLTAGTVKAKATLSQEAGAPMTLALDAGLNGLDVIDPTAAVLTGKAARLKGTLTLLDDGGVQISDAAFEPATGNILLTANGRLTGDNTIDAVGWMRVPNLAVLSDVAGLPLHGSVVTDVKITGRTNAPAVTADLRGNGAALRELPLKDLKLQADYKTGKAATAALSFISPEGAPQNLRVVLGPDAKGDLSLDEVAGSIFGVTLQKADTPRSVRLQAPDLVPLGQAMALALGPEVPRIRRGALDMTLALDRDVKADVKARNLILETGDGEIIRIRTADLSGTLQDGENGRLEVAGDATNVTIGENRFARMKVQASGTLDAPDFSLSTEEGVKGGLRLSLKGKMRPGPAQDRHLTLTEFDASLGDAAIALADPVQLTLGAQGSVEASLRARVEDRATGRKGTVEGSFLRNVKGMNASLTMKELPFGLLRYVPGMPQIAGRASGNFSFATHADNPRGLLDLTVSGLGRTPEFQGGELVTRGSWNGAQAVMTLTMGGGPYGSLQFAGTLPLLARGAGLPEIRSGAQISGTITGEGHMEDFWPYLPLPQHMVTGAAIVDLTVSGPFDRPDVTGTARITNGTYESLASGLTARDLQLTADLQGRSGRLRLEGNDGSKGKMTGAGRVSFAGNGFDLDADLQLEQFQVVRRDDFNARATGVVKVAGNDDEGIDVTGRLAIDEADIKVPDQLPPTIVDLETETVSGDDLDDPEIVSREKDKPAVLPIRLSIDVTAERSVSVKGRGLQSLWNADAHISGLADSPRVKGEIALARGKLDFISREFTLSRGAIIFDGGRRTDPRLNIEARHSAHEITAIVLIQGTASNPTMKLSSQPVLRQDEILAQLLFGKSVSELSTVELLQIAQVLATLSGGGGGGIDLLGKARDVLGIDVLKVDVDTESDNPAENVSVTVGKYVSERIYVGVKQGTQPGSSAVTLEVELTDNLKLKTDVSQSSESSIGLTWQKDY